MTIPLPITASNQVPHAIRLRRNRVHHIDLTWDVRTCTACPLQAKIRAAGHGPVHARVALVSQNPSRVGSPNMLGAFLVPYLAVYQQHGRPAPVAWRRGATGIFWEIATLADLDLSMVYSTSAVHCATPSNRLPTPAEFKPCRTTHLHQELAELPHLEAVVAFGKLAADAFGLGLHGSTRLGNARVLAVPHPAWYLRHRIELAAVAMRIREFLRDLAPLKSSSQNKEKI